MLVKGIVKQNSCSTGIVLQCITTASCNEFAAVAHDAADECCTSKTLKAKLSCEDPHLLIIGELTLFSIIPILC